jgi:hypothetical protein
MEQMSLNLTRSEIIRVLGMKFGKYEIVDLMPYQLYIKFAKFYMVIEYHPLQYEEIPMRLFIYRIIDCEHMREIFRGLFQGPFNIDDFMSYVSTIMKDLSI